MHIGSGSYISFTLHILRTYLCNIDIVVHWNEDLTTYYNTATYELKCINNNNIIELFKLTFNNILDIGIIYLYYNFSYGTLLLLLNT